MSEYKAKFPFLEFKVGFPVYSNDMPREKKLSAWKQIRQFDETRERYYKQLLEGMFGIPQFHHGDSVSDRD